MKYVGVHVMGRKPALGRQNRKGGGVYEEVVYNGKER
jgi:hypothetical protein